MSYGVLGYLLGHDRISAAGSRSPHSARGAITAATAPAAAGSHAPFTKQAAPVTYASRWCTVASAALHTFCARRRAMSRTQARAGRNAADCWCAQLVYFMGNSGSEIGAQLFVAPLSGGEPRQVGRCSACLAGARLAGGSRRDLWIGGVQCVRASAWPGERSDGQRRVADAHCGRSHCASADPAQA